MKVVELVRRAKEAAYLMHPDDKELRINARREIISHMIDINILCYIKRGYKK